MQAVCWWNGPEPLSQEQDYEAVIALGVVGLNQFASGPDARTWLSCQTLMEVA